MTELLRTTNENDIAPLSSQGQPVNLLWQDLQAYLAARLGPEGEELLAEPVAGAGGQTDWYGKQGSPRPTEELTARLETLKELLATPPRTASATERQIAALLPLVLTVPDSSYLVAGPHGPVLVAWGNQPVTQKLEQREITAHGKARPLPTASTAPKAETAPPPQTSPRLLPPLPPTMPLPTKRAVGPWWLWLMALLLLLLGVFLLWFLPHLQPWINLLLCRWPHLLFWLTVILLLVALAGLLIPLLCRFLHHRDLRLARRADAKAGVLQIVVCWEDGNELDLHIVCPNGHRLCFLTPEGAGGNLQSRLPLSNTEKGMESGFVENAFWEVAPPAGLYTVLVDPALMPQRSATPYRLSVFYKGRLILRHQGIARAGERCMPVGSFVLPG